MPALSDKTTFFSCQKTSTRSAHFQSKKLSHQCISGRREILAHTPSQPSPRTQRNSLPLTTETQEIKHGIITVAQEGLLSKAETDTHTKATAGYQNAAS